MRRRRLALSLGAALTAGVVPMLSTGAWAGAKTTSQLQQQLGSTQSQLGANRAHQQSLASRISALNGKVSQLAGQVSLVQAREAAARARLDSENAQLSYVRTEVARERARIIQLHRILRQARRALAAELVSQYERPEQSFVTLLIDAHGFQQLVDGIQYVSNARRHEQSIVLVTRTAQRDAVAASRRLAALERKDASAADTAATQTDALAGMHALFVSRQTALLDERSAQAAALSATQAHGAQLQDAIATIKKQQAAAVAAARAVAQQPPSSGGSSDSGAGDSATPSGGSGGWAIPYPVVLCESGGQNLPPNGAGASGYYQIMPGTWKDYGGSGPSAYQASKAEQDAVAAKIWAGGAGASNWTCAAMVGIR